MIELKPNWHVRVGRKVYDVSWIIMVPLGLLAAYFWYWSIANYGVLA